MGTAAETIARHPGRDFTRTATFDELVRYYSEAGADYSAWSRALNMHFGFYRWGTNPFDREAMLERMNEEVLARLNLDGGSAGHLLDMGCGVAATARYAVRTRRNWRVTGITIVPWQIRRAMEMMRGCMGRERIILTHGDYRAMRFRDGSFDGVYALESACYAPGAAKESVVREAFRVLRPGGRFVVADGFLSDIQAMGAVERRIHRRACECWAMETFGELDRFVASLEDAGFRDIRVEDLRWRVAPSAFHIPVVTIRFLYQQLIRGRNRLTRERWNNVLGPILGALLGLPGGQLGYYMITAVKPAS
jgi:SAM-dependent methyltransferase